MFVYLHDGTTNQFEIKKKCPRLAVQVSHINRWIIELVVLTLVAGTKKDDVCLLI